ncbi:hypothetical protein QAD02_009568 [Eretmocerus hayati]|uniref:Uncharacterized protein n=1 Tax=Eretmocerus hayati TaxID=131215 RepID=A0ACC2NE66_9HYME|nr:hypothetical protein QAD02_009568 [Eretmocerus hayati]
MAQILRKMININPQKYNLFRNYTCRTPPAPPYKIRHAYPCDHERLLEFMVDTYFQAEPSLVNIGLAGKPSPLLLYLMQQSIKEGLSLVCIDRSNNCIVGAAINTSPTKEGCKSTLELVCCSECEKSRELIKFFVYCSKECNLWDKYCINHFFECSHVAVHPEHQGHGIAKRLVEESWILARDLPSSLFRIDASSRYTAKICESLGFDCEWSIEYKKYCCNGQFPFQNIKEPHTQFTVYSDKLDFIDDYYPSSSKKQKK